MWDIYISPRKNKSDEKYDFVWFLEVTNPKRLEYQLDNIHIRDIKLFVYLPRFGMTTTKEVKIKQGVMDSHDSCGVERKNVMKEGGLSFMKSYTQVAVEHKKPITLRWEKVQTQGEIIKEGRWNGEVINMEECN